MIIKFDIYNEEFSFDKIESEEVVIDINDYVEEYDNIFKDRYRCVKAVGPIFNVKDLFKGRFGMWIRRPDRYKGQNNEEKFEIIDGWDCDIEQIKLKKGDSIVIWPDKADRVDRINRLKDKNRKGLDKISTRLSLRFNEEKKIVIPAGRIVVYNITEFLRDAQMKLLGTQGYANSSNRVIRGTTPKSHNGREDMVTIPRANYITTKFGYVAVMSERRKPFINRWGQEVWSDEETYLDITKPIYGKTIQWIDPEIDPYGEEEWDDITESIATTFDRLIKTDITIEYENIKKLTNNDLDILNKDFIGWVKVEPDLHDYVMYVNSWKRDKNRGLLFTYIGYFESAGDFRENRNPRFIRCEENTYQLNENNLVITKYNEKEIMRIISEKDPYGEEDWEEYLGEQFNLDDDEMPSQPPLIKDIYLKFSEYLRFDLLGLKKLNRLREFFEDHIVSIDQNGKKTKGRIHKIKPIKIDGDQYYTIDMLTKKGEVTITISDGDKFKVKKKKKIKSPVDIYGEEDWELLGDDVPTPEEPVKPKAGKGKAKIIKPLKKEDFEKFLKNKEEGKKARKEENEKKMKDWLKTLKPSKPKTEEEIFWDKARAKEKAAKEKPKYDKFNPNELNY